jgi:hypothetical protein
MRYTNFESENCKRRPLGRPIHRREENIKMDVKVRV